MSDPVPHRPDLVVDETAPADFVSLCWRVFFELRARGVSMPAHFPWLTAPGQAFFVIDRSGQDVRAGCAVRFIADRTGERRAGAIGLVCVDPRHRGQGHATRVLERAVQHADRLGLVDLVLWTSHPGLYERHGFRPDDNALVGTVSAPARASGGWPEVTRSTWPAPGDERGLPPFASQGECWRSTAASAIVLQGADGAILAEWTGADDDVADLLARALPATCRMNALASDSLPSVLAARGWTVRLAPAQLRMIRTSDRRVRAPRVDNLRVLDRV